MKSSFKKVLVACTVAAGFFFVLKDGKPTHASTILVQGQVSPAAIYATHCTSCHGRDGRSNTAKGRKTDATDLTSSDWNTDEARGMRIIANGKGEMPGFKKKLNATQMRGVFGYSLRFRR